MQGDPITRRALAFLALACQVSVPPVAAQAEAPRLELESRFWPNLHQFLYLVAQSELELVPADRATVRAVRDDAARAVELGGEQRAGWERAVEHYKSSVARLSIWAELAAINSLLAMTPDAGTPTGAANSGTPTGLLAARSRSLVPPLTGAASAPASRS